MTSSVSEHAPAAIAVSEEIPPGKTTTIVFPSQFLRGSWWQPLALVVWPRGLQQAFGSLSAGPFILEHVRIGGVEQMPGPCGFGPQDAGVHHPAAWSWIGTDRQLELDVTPVTARHAIWLDLIIECRTTARTDEPPQSEES